MAPGAELPEEAPARDSGALCRHGLVMAAEHLGSSSNLFLQRRAWVRNTIHPRSAVVFDFSFTIFGAMAGRFLKGKRRGDDQFVACTW